MMCFAGIEFALRVLSLQSGHSRLSQFANSKYTKIMSLQIGYSRLNQFATSKCTQFMSFQIGHSRLSQFTNQYTTQIPILIHKKYEFTKWT